MGGREGRYFSPLSQALIHLVALMGLGLSDPNANSNPNPKPNPNPKLHSRIYHFDNCLPVYRNGSLRKHEVTLQ